MTQIRVIFIALALTGLTLATARPADACGGPYLPPTDEQVVSSLVRAHVQATAKETEIAAIEARVTAGLVAVVKATLRSGDRTRDEYYLLRKRDGAWKLVDGAGVTPEPTKTAGRG